jgi:DNA-binding transcriptional MocR family regulator
MRSLLAKSNPGDQLPSSRELVERYRVSPVTVARVIARLAAEGAVVTRPGRGTFVAAQAHKNGQAADMGWQTVALTDRVVDTRSLTDSLRRPPDGTIMLDGGYMHPSLQPTQLLSAALSRAARRPDVWNRAPTNGVAELRAVFAGVAGGSVAPDDVLITAGGQSALSMAFRALAGPGSPVLVESPTYPGALAAARAAGLRPTPVPVDADGVRPDLLAEAFAMTGARLFYCQPTYQNPTGCVLSPERRKKVVDVARAAGAFLIEDDFARYLGHGDPVARPLVADDRDGTVVYVTSFTKPSAPSMRVGALVARGPVMERMRAIRQVDDFFVARPLQEAALEMVSAPSWNRHTRALGTVLRDRCAELANAVACEFPDWMVRRPHGGLHLWAQLPAGSDQAQLADAARRNGVSISEGSRFFATEPPAPFVRLAFAATNDHSELVTAVHRLKASGGASSRRGPGLQQTGPPT